MNIYIASRYDNRKEKRLKELVKVLKSAGHKIVSSWLDDPVEHDTMPCAYNSVDALVDIDDIHDSDVFLLWHHNVAGANGGMFWEMGYAYATGRPMVVLNPNNEKIKMIFALLPDVIHTHTVKHTVDVLKQLEEENA